MPLLNNLNALGASGLGRAGLIAGPKTGIIGGLRTIKWGALLTNTQRTLNLVNQAIPIYHQAKPVFSNMKTARKIMNVINEPDETDVKSSKPVSTDQDKIESNTNNPTFFY